MSNLKKVIDIIRLPEASEALLLALDYKIQRRALKRYLQSLKIFKERICSNSEQMNFISSSLSEMRMTQGKPRKNVSEIEYFMYNGVKIFATMQRMMEKMQKFYSSLLSRTESLLKTINQTLKKHKKNVIKSAQFFQTQISNYISHCFPQLDSILFKIGFTDASKIKKKEDSFREKLAIHQCKKHCEVLSECLKEIEELKNEAIDVGREYYEGSRDHWCFQINQAFEEIGTFETDKEEVAKMAEETGGGSFGGHTDRSFNSMGDADECQNEV